MAYATNGRIAAYKPSPGRVQRVRHTRFQPGGDRRDGKTARNIVRQVAAAIPHEARAPWTIRPMRSGAPRVASHAVIPDEAAAPWVPIRPIVAYPAKGLAPAGRRARGLPNPLNPLRQDPRRRLAQLLL